MLSKNFVELKAPPFACRGRQFHLRAPLSVDAGRQRAFRMAIRQRWLGKALAAVRDSDTSGARARVLRARRTAQVTLAAQEKLLVQRLRDLEQQRETLLLLREQVEKQEQLRAKEDVAAAAAAASAANDSDETDKAKPAADAAVAPAHQPKPRN